MKFSKGITGLEELLKCEDISIGRYNKKLIEQYNDPFFIAIIHSDLVQVDNLLTSKQSDIESIFVANTLDEFNLRKIDKTTIVKSLIDKPEVEFMLTEVKPIHLAILLNNSDLIKLLLKHQANINTPVFSTEYVYYHQKNENFVINVFNDNEIIKDFVIKNLCENGAVDTIKLLFANGIYVSKKFIYDLESQPEYLIKIIKSALYGQQMANKLLHNTDVEEHCMIEDYDETIVNSYYYKKLTMFLNDVINEAIPLGSGATLKGCRVIHNLIYWQRIIHSQ